MGWHSIANPQYPNSPGQAANDPLGASVPPRPPTHLNTPRTLPSPTPHPTPSYEEDSTI